MNLLEARTNIEIYERDYLLSCHYGDYKRALELAEKLYDMKCSMLGKKHPDILKLLKDLAYFNYKLGKLEKSLEIKEQIYAFLCNLKGQEHPESLQALSDLVYSYGKLEKTEKMLLATQKLYELQCKVNGEKDENTLITLEYLVVKQSDLKKALELAEKLYSARCEIFGTDSSGAEEALKLLNEINTKIQENS